MWSLIPRSAARLCLDLGLFGGGRPHLTIDVGNCELLQLSALRLAMCIVAALQLFVRREVRDHLRRRQGLARIGEGGVGSR